MHEINLIVNEFKIKIWDNLSNSGYKMTCLNVSSKDPKLHPHQNWENGLVFHGQYNMTKSYIEREL